MSIYFQCTADTGEFGTFIGYNKTPISPVFPDFLHLLFWMKQNGYRTTPGNYSGVEKCS